MARPKLTDKHVLFIRLADELVSNIARGGDLERSLVRDIRELDDDKRALTLDYAVKALLTTRKEEVMAALAGQLAKVEEDEAAERAAKRAAADKKTQALAAVAKRLHTLRKTKKRSQ